MTSHLFLVLSAGHFHRTEDECDCTSRLWLLVAAKNAACIPLGSESASARYFYDCLKQGLKLGCRSPNEAPERLPLIQSKLTPSLPSTHSVLVFFFKCGPTERRANCPTPLWAPGLTVRAYLPFMNSQLCHVAHGGRPVKSLSE